MSKIVVLTGFEPFADFQVNPSWEAAQTFDNKEIGSFKVKSFRIPLAYKEIKPAITKIINAQKPTVIINLGQSYRPLISLEKIAINFADLTESNTLYNCGTRSKDEILEPNAPAAYFTTLPIREIFFTRCTKCTATDWTCMQGSYMSPAYHPKRHNYKRLEKERYQAWH